jgi:hypothetical protein
MTVADNDDDNDKNADGSSKGCVVTRRTQW